MAPPRSDKPYKLYTDACDYAIGAILVERVIQYISHSLSSTQRKWATIEKEEYTVVYAIEKLRPYLYGLKFTVYTDHKPLTSLFTRQIQNTKIQRWGILIAEYGATVEYRKGKINIRADMLSRIKNEVATIDCDDWVDPEALSDDNIAELLPRLHDGIDLAKIVSEQKKEYPKLFPENGSDNNAYTIIKGVLYSARRPSNTSASYPRLILPTTWQTDVIIRAHREVGHMATEKTLERLREAYVWPNMRDTIKHTLNYCSICQSNQRHADHVQMVEMPIANSPFQINGADLIGPFIESPNGNKYIL